MEYIYSSKDRNSIKYAILIKDTSSYLPLPLNTFYFKPLEALGIPKNQIVLITIPSVNKKLPAKETKLELEKVAQGLNILGIKTILIPNGDLYKYITGVPKTSDCFGEPRIGKLAGFEQINTVLSIDHNALLYNDSLRFKLDNSLEVFYTAATNILVIKKDIIEVFVNPITAKDIEGCLWGLLAHPELTCDIETESLRFERARICTIAFAWNKHEGIAFSVDTKEEAKIRKLLVWFFKTYTGVIIMHNALYDAKVIIYQLFMEHSLDIDGLRDGLFTFNDVEDSMIITYLAKNSTHDIELGLKENSFEYAGNYGIEFKHDGDIHKYPRDEILEYNLRDALCTWYVYEKNYPIAAEAAQIAVYREIFQPSIMPLLYMMLIGLPMNMLKVHAADKQLDEILAYVTKDLRAIKEIENAVAILKQQRLIKDNADRKEKAKNPDKIKIKIINDINDEEFNPNSDKQKRVLLYDVLGLPVLNFTDTKQASCDANTLDSLIHHTKDPHVKHIIELLQEFSSASTVSSTFIKAFIKYAFTREDGSVWLNGNKRLGGTQSGRLSANSPNLENLPNTSEYGLLIKACFEAPPGYLFGGADYASLEDRINAILTQDPNKIKVYTDGYDGHCLRAHSYFGDQMPDIIDTVESINSIAVLYKPLRQDSKQPTFALTYLGTWHTLVKNLGLTKIQAKAIEDNYHKLYAHSDIWSEKQIEFASLHGYVECAFGLRLRTPLLAQTLRTSRNNVYAAESEGRSAVNAVSQSWGMLINRASIVLIRRLLSSDYYDKIFPCNTIHDAAYFVFLDDNDTIQWLNENLVKEMRWNDHPKIKSTDVPMEANLDIGTSWDKQYTLSNDANDDEINDVRNKIYG